MTNDPERLREIVEAQHGGRATTITTVEVHDRFDGETAWHGIVHVFALEDHPGGATRAYAWSYEMDNGKTRTVAVLQAGPITSPTDAVRAAIVAEHKARQ